jgi:hypothetical protein
MVAVRISGFKKAKSKEFLEKGREGVNSTAKQKNGRGAPGTRAALRALRRAAQPEECGEKPLMNSNPYEWNSDSARRGFACATCLKTSGAPSSLRLLPNGKNV